MDTEIKYRRLPWFDMILLASLLVLFYILFFLPVDLPKKTLSLSVSAVLLLILGLSGVQNYRGRLQSDSVLISFLSGLNIRPLQLAIFVFILFSSSLAFVSYFRHQVFESSFDFAIFSQAIWNTWKGAFLYSSIKGGICLLGDHVSPVLVVFAPLYGIWKDPAVLFMAQAVIAASAVFPLYLTGREVLKDKTLAFVFVMAYMMYAPLRGAVRFDFHPEILADPLLLWAFFFFLRNRLEVTSVFLAGVLLTKEIACMPVAMFGFYAFWFKKKRFFGISWIVVSICYFLFSIYWIAPHYSGTDYFYLSGKYGVWKEKGIGAMLSHVFHLSSLNYLFRIFLPLGFLSFLGPSTLLLTLPIVFQNLITPGDLTRSIYFHYSSLLTSFVFISAIYGTRNLILFWSKDKIQLQKVSRTLVTYWILVWSILYLGKSDIHVIRGYQSQETTHFAYVRDYLKSVPADASVRTHEFFAPHVAMRQELHIYENQHPGEGGSQKARNTDYVIVDRLFLGENQNQKLSDIEQNGYAVLHEHNGFFVFRRVKG